jgi:hypothetical protein
MNQLRSVHQALLDAARRKAERKNNDYILTLLKGESVGKEGLPQASVDCWNLYLGFKEGEVYARFDSQYHFVVFEDRAGNPVCVPLFG